MIDKHFPDHNRFSKIFNRNTLKISYSCTPSMKTIIASHNKSLCDPQQNTAPPCNCRQQACPMDGNCRTSDIVYKATVSTAEATDTMEYIGSTETDFKTRYANHKYSFNHYQRRTATKLSQYIWEKKTEDKNVKIEWKIQKKARPYRCGTRKCDLCITEKYEILKNDPDITLNRRTELANKCRHRTKFKLEHLK